MKIVMKCSIVSVFFMLCCLTGCAVMKVDVDIYKGPLSNHREVQSEQMYAMAIAAKPMLTRLKEMKQLPETQRQTVDAILSLYKNRMPEVLSNFMQEITEASELYASSIAAFDASQYESWWKHFKPCATEQTKTLLKGYANFFSDEKEWTWKRDILEGTDENQHDSLGAWHTVYCCEHLSNKIDANTAFLELRKPEVVAIHAKQLFPGEDEQAARDKFVAKVTNRAEAFLKARAALRGLLMAALDGLREKKSNDRGHVLDDYPRTQDAAIRLVTRLVRFGYLKQVVCPQNEFKVLGSISNLNGMTLEDFQRQLAQKLKNEPDAIVEDLMKADKLLTENKYFCINESEKTQYLESSIHRYGLAMGPDPSDEKSIMVKALKDSVGDDVKTIFSSFGSLQFGRTDEGLNTLVENYLKKKGENQNNNSPNKDIAEKKLVDALVAFAEKTLFLANNEYFLTTNAEDNAANVPLSVNDGDASTGLVESKTDNVELYIHVLQAIGNSIMTLADDYKYRKEYEKGLKNKWQIEVAALKQVYSKDAVTVLHLMIDELRVERNRLLQVKLKGLDDLSVENIPKSFSQIEIELAAAAKALSAVQKEKSEANVTKAAEAVARLAKKISEVAGAVASEKKIFEQTSEAMSKWREGNKEAFTLNTAIEELGNYVDWAAGKGAVAVNATAFVDELILKLAKDRQPDQESKEVARQQITKRKFSIISVGNIDGVREEPQQVVDQLKAILQYQLAQEVQINGAGTKTAESIGAAIKLLASYRGEMAFLRTSGTYLRNSYPSTSLQPNPGIFWDNMLERQSARSWMPFIPSWLSSVEKKTNNEIDKQFWQNINSIRVSGGGDTNYVIAKDDIGNWYVKAYSTNPEDIVASAKNLALFSFSPALKTSAITSKKVANAAAGMVEVTESGGKTETTATTEKQNVVDTLLDKYETKYLAQLSVDRDEFEKVLSDNVDGLKTAIVAAWEANEDIKQTKVDDKSYLDRLKEVLNTTASLVLEPARLELEPSKQITVDSAPAIRAGFLSALASVRRFGTVLKRSVLAIRVTAPQGGGGERAEKIAPELVTTVVRNTLNRFIERRQNEVSQYKTALGFLAEGLK